MNKDVTFKESRIAVTTLLLMGMGFLMTAIPEPDLSLFLFNEGLALISGALFYYFWRTLKHKRKRYFSLLSFVMINCLAIYFAIPLLRMYFLTLTFWIGITMLAVMVVLPYVYSRAIAAGIQNPRKSILGKIYSIYAALVILFGGAAYKGSVTTVDLEAQPIALIAFSLAILFLFIAPVMLIKPAEMDKINEA